MQHNIIKQLNKAILKVIDCRVRIIYVNLWNQSILLGLNGLWAPDSVRTPLRGLQLPLHQLSRPAPAHRFSTLSAPFSALLNRALVAESESDVTMWLGMFPYIFW